MENLQEERVETLSPIANSCEEASEKVALVSFRCKPIAWFRFDRDTFTISSHDRDTLQMFLEHFNNKAQ